MAIKTTPKTSSSAPSKIAPKAVAPAPVKAAAPAPAKAKATYQPSQEDIAARAFEIFEREGGNEQDNWYRAERELVARGRK
jgi:hypothetical protein